MTLSRRNDSKIRQYRPKVGQLIGMSEFSDYTSRGMSPWGRLRVIGIDQDTVTVRHAPHPMDATCDDPSQITIPLYVVRVPVGWEPKYTIHCKPEQAETIIKDWFARGIVVRQSHDMSGGMSTAFQPLTNGTLPGSPHWQFPEDTDVIMPEDCARLFKVVAVEREEITSATLGYPADPNCTLSRMGRTKRAKLFKTMRADGWEVQYVPYAGGYWERTRKTLVHDWAV
jgi:hypothetical protein